MSGVTQVSEHTFEIGGMGGAAEPLRVDPPLSSPAAVKIAREAITSNPKAPTTRQILAQLRGRLRDVKRELRNKKALEREREQLQRLIKAATTELDNVRRLRAAG